MSRETLVSCSAALMRAQRRTASSMVMVTFFMDTNIVHTGFVSI